MTKLKIVVYGHKETTPEDTRPRHSNIEQKYVLSSDAVKFHIVDNIDCRYILYAINSQMFMEQVYENVQGVTRVRTCLQKLRKYCLPIPPYQEQRRIVTKIEEVFKALDALS